ncbi:MAG: hypothetical protein FWE41_07000 [Coriobacteriia bacterium]|nr:hypothetical protein [Coriobacteriia bacterium]
MALEPKWYTNPVPLFQSQSGTLTPSLCTTLTPSLCTKNPGKDIYAISWS